jgi:hypothetical protein
MHFAWCTVVTEPGTEISSGHFTLDARKTSDYLCAVAMCMCCKCVVRIPSQQRLERQRLERLERNKLPRWSARRHVAVFSLPPLPPPCGATQGDMCVPITLAILSALSASLLHLFFLYASRLTPLECQARTTPHRAAAVRSHFQSLCVLTSSLFNPYYQHP